MSCLLFILLTVFEFFEFFFLGLLNTIVFMQDIAITRAYRLTKLRWWINYVNKYEELYPHLSRNKAFISSTNPMVNNEEKKEEQKRPSFAETLRYNFLTLIFKKPKESDAIISDDPYYIDKNDDDDRINISNGVVDLEKDNELQENQEYNKEVLSKL